MIGRRRSLATLILIAGVAGLAACSSPQPGPSPSKPSSVTSAPAASAPAAGVPAPPINVDAIPDAVPRIEPRSLRGNPPFYEVFGKRYTVLASSEGHVERGTASWYGPGFHAAQTSTGEPYDMYAMTAAHKTLPLPCYARVTNLANGRSVVVRINDRGPFVGDRIIDLSYTAASKLDMLRAGTAPVEVRVVTPATAVATLPAPAPAGASALPAGPALYVQAGAFADDANARALAARLTASGIPDVAVVPLPSGDRVLHRVRIGPLADAAAYDALRARLAQQGVTGTRLVTE